MLAQRRLEWLAVTLFFASLALALLGHAERFYGSPPVWPDEALFASPALSLARHGSFDAPVLEGLWPTVERGVYFVPPTYPALIGLLFALFGEAVAVMRGFSIGCSLVVLALVYGLARRLELSRGVAMLAPAMLALDPVFSRGARVGRMDMLALALALCALWWVLAPDAPRSPRRALALGAVCGLAVTVHPMASCVLPVVALCMLSKKRDRATVSFALLGFLLGSAPWSLWIARDVAAFWAQWSDQLARKAHNWNNYGPEPWQTAFEFALSQYPAQRIAVASAYLLSALGMAVAGSHGARWAFAFAVLALASILRGAEMWYTVWITPLLPLGLLAPLRGPERWRAPFALVACATLALFAVRELRARQHPPSDYPAWSESVVARLPRGSRVLLAAVPDPFFATLDRPDLTVKEMLPGGLPFAAARAERVVEQLDYIVIGRHPLTPWVQRTLAEHGRLAFTVGPTPDGALAQVFALHR